MDNIISTHIAPEEADDFWSMAEPYITAALDRGKVTEYGPEDVLQEIKQEHVALFLVMNKETRNVVGAYTLAFHEYPNDIICTIAQAGADNLDELLSCFAGAERFAKFNGATKMCVWGRKGWKKSLAEVGFSESFTAFEKSL